MIRNSICPYCKIRLEVSENSPASRSVEHLVPNAALSRKRNKHEGDFYACRRCNSNKSKIDFALGFLSKIQSDDVQAAREIYDNAGNIADGRRKIHQKMEVNKRVQGEEAVFDIPITADDLIEYAHYLGKGQYFKTKFRPYNESKLLMKILFANKGLTGTFAMSYFDSSGQDPFRDLEVNEFTESILDGECLIWCKGSEYLFVFNRYTVIGIEVLRNSKKNRRRVNIRNSEIQKILATTSN